MASCFGAVPRKPITVAITVGSGTKPLTYASRKQRVSQWLESHCPLQVHTPSDPIPSARPHLLKVPLPTKTFKIQTITVVDK